ncbi:DUF6538 domain-containing protein [Terasakiella sp. A23]|uniref:DUF6538 domain-containing protein n=1 Tax=Terasakiella sp. FCG-A23 TaxID=3080561 RepID=UPI0039864EBF
MGDQTSEYIFKKRNVFYFTRRIPKDVRDHYNRDRIVLSLRTCSKSLARSEAASLAAQLDEDWLILRRKIYGDPFERFLQSRNAVDLARSDAPLFSEAKSIYLKAKSAGRPRTFVTAIDRAEKNLITALGDKPIDTYTRADANRLRDAYAKRGLSKATIHRAFNVIRAILNFVSREEDLPEIRCFSGVFLGDDIVNAPQERKPVPLNIIRKVQRQCKDADTDTTRLIAAISDTGMRLSEAAGLVKSDIVFDQKHPHIVLKPHKWRRLKNKNSERIIPLVGAAYWAVTRASLTSRNDFLFPQYCNTVECKGGVASTYLNKWMAKRVPKGCVIHSFRHSLRDRLRAIQCPPDIVDRLGGWTVGGVGEGYVE